MRSHGHRVRADQRHRHRPGPARAPGPVHIHPARPYPQSVKPAQRARAQRFAASSLAVLVLTACSNEDRLVVEPANGKSPPASPATTPTPYDWSDCESLQAGDPLDFDDLRCHEDIQVETLNCANNVIYVRLIRPGRDTLEGMVGQTPNWLKAQPPDADHGWRTPWSFDNCLEVE